MTGCFDCGSRDVVLAYAPEQRGSESALIVQCKECGLHKTFTESQQRIDHIRVDGNVATAVFGDGTVISLGKDPAYQGKNIQQFNVKMGESQ